MGISKIRINGLEYEVVDKAARDFVNRWNEPYLPYPDKEKTEVYSEDVTDGFTVADYDYFYFTSTNKDRVLYTKAGNTLKLNRVYVTEYLSNEIGLLNEDEIITIHYED